LRSMYRAFIVVSLVLCSALTFGQGEANSLKGEPFNERFIVGGGLGLSISSVQDFVSVSPEVGYRVTARLIPGIGITYRYTNYKYFRPSIKLSDYGVSPFVRFIVHKNIFIHTEVQYLNYEFPTSSTETIRRDFTSFLAGGGFFQPVGGRASLYIMALYNFSYKDTAAGTYSPYASPLVIRAGINIGNLGF
jgi:hypothetical protein